MDGRYSVHTIQKKGQQQHQHNKINDWNLKQLHREKREWEWEQKGWERRLANDVSAAINIVEKNCKWRGGEWVIEIHRKSERERASEKEIATKSEMWKSHVASARIFRIQCVCPSHNNNNTRKYEFWKMTKLCSSMWCLKGLNEAAFFFIFIFLLI